MEERAKSEFNAALEYLQRLILLKQAAAEASMSLDAYSWLHSLSAIVRWVSHHMRDEEKTHAENTIIRIQTMIQRSGKKTRGIPSYNMNTELYKELHSFEIWLNDIIKDAGLYARMQEDATAALR